LNLQTLRVQAGAHLQRGELGLAAELYNRIVRRNPQDIEALLALAAINGMSGRYAEAEACCRRVLRLQPRLPGAWLNLGSAQSAQGDYMGAAGSYRRVIELKPDTLVAYQSLGNTLRRLDSHMEAVDVFNRALALQPRHAGIRYDLGNTWKACGDVGRAVACFREALRIEPDNLQAHANLIACMLYDEATDRDALFREQTAWGRALERDQPARPEYPSVSLAERRLRVGYCSPDFRNHSVAFFFEPLLGAHDCDRFETFCYSQTEHPDAITQRLRALADHWRDTCGMDSDVLYDRIRADGIDILVDLAGLTHGNRLEVFARRPAPVQINYLGYASTTGLSSMQYRLTDAWADPPGETDRYHTERLVRLPHGFLCYRPPADAPAITPLPALENGYITFGSFNNLAKVTPAVVGLWSRLLRAVPGSRLLCKAQRLSDRSIRRRYMALFEAHGIALENVELLGQVESFAAHLGLYGRVDIGLDTFPYNGTTTTCEALWMGVPVVVLQGDRHLARVGASLLQQVGLQEYIARDREEYLGMVIDLARDPARLAALRYALRDRVGRSLLCDPVAFARDVEAAYLDCWKARERSAARA
jgi:predicted O-linked N-acetylglucosamine transferase (SPINDLY family)